jgi:phosphate/sulfate permease
VDPRHPDPHLHAGQLFHGSNDGQKGMGLIMLILIGTVPTDAEHRLW